MFCPIKSPQTGAIMSARVFVSEFQLLRSMLCALAEGGDTSNMSSGEESDGVEVWDDDDNALHEYSETAPPLPQEEELSAFTSTYSGYVVYRLSTTFPSKTLYLRCCHESNKFMHTFFRVLSHFSSFLGPIASSMPSSTYVLKQTSRQVTFKRYVVCSKCHRLSLSRLF